MTLLALRAKTPVDLSRARDRIDWVEDDELREIESKSRVGAAALGFFTWGGGRLYLGDRARGLGLIAALIAWMAVSPLLWASLGPVVYSLVGALGALWAERGARDVNRFVATRNELALRAGPDPSSYRLLAAAAAVNPALAAAMPVLPAPAAAAPPTAGPHGELIDRLRKLHALRHAGVLHDAEVRDRKVDLLGAAVPATRGELDELLFALLPLGDEGVLGPDDFEFLKQLGEQR